MRDASRAGLLALTLLSTPLAGQERDPLCEAVMYADEEAVAALLAQGPTIIDVMGDQYPELVKRRDAIMKITLQEEERFQKTLKSGWVMLEDLVGNLRAKGKTEIAGADAFKLHDTYGFALELTRDYAREFNMTVDEPGFRKAMDEQANRSRATSKIGIVHDKAEQLYRDTLDELVASERIPSAGAALPGRIRLVEGRLRPRLVRLNERHRLGNLEIAHKLRTDPRLEPLRKREDFQKLLRDLETQVQQNEEKKEA